MKSTVLYSWWLRRRTGGAPLHRNPLCRPSDRLQQISAWAWFFVAALTIPVVSVAAAPAMTATTAVVEHVAEDPVVVGPTAAVNIHRTYAVQVRWITGSGSIRRGSVETLTPPRKDAKIHIWATRSGDRVSTAQPRNSRALDMIVLLVNVAVDVCLAGYGAHRLLRWQLDRRRMRTWDAELGQLLARR